LSSTPSPAPGPAAPSAASPGSRQEGLRQRLIWPRRRR
jgi:hypothetical protein